MLSKQLSLIALLVAAAVGVAVCASTGGVFGFVGDEYQKLGAHAKAELLWERVAKDATSGDWPGTFALLGLIAGANMDTSFDAVGDEMPLQQGWNRWAAPSPRAKLVHSVGAVARAKFTSTGAHPFTGMFKGANEVLLRWSLAGEVEDGDTFTPAVAVKMLVDGLPSVNWMNMFSLTGASDTTFPFAHDLSNHIPAPGKDCPKKLTLVASAFERGSKWGNMLGLSHVAMHTQDGTKEAEPAFPFRVVMKPTAAVKKIYNGGQAPTAAQWAPEFEGIPADTVVYELFAEAHPHQAADSPPVKLGDFTTTTAPTTSYFGDKSLFFQHARKEADFKLKPEWENAAKAMNEEDEHLEKQRYPVDLEL